MAIELQALILTGEGERTELKARWSDAALTYKVW